MYRDLFTAPLGHCARPFHSMAALTFLAIAGYCSSFSLAYRDVVSTNGMDAGESTQRAEHKGTQETKLRHAAKPGHEMN